MDTANAVYVILGIIGAIGTIGAAFYLAGQLKASAESIHDAVESLKIEVAKIRDDHEERIRDAEIAIARIQSRD